MRTCSECGCYLPDGKTECLACGHDAALRDIALSPGGGGADGGRPDYWGYGCLRNGFAYQAWPAINYMGAATRTCSVASLQAQLNQQLPAQHCTRWGYYPGPK